jgi:hypothetical protein
MSSWELAVVAVTGFVIFIAVVFSLVAYLGWRGLSAPEDDE